MSVLDRETLESSKLADLHALASELSLDGYRRLRKDDLIDALIAHQGGAVAADVSAADPDDAADPSANGAASGEGRSSSRRSRSRRGRGGARRDEDASEAVTAADGDEVAVDDQPVAATEADSSREEEKNGSGAGNGRRRGGRGRSRTRGGEANAEVRDEDTGDERESREEVEIVSGTVELLAGGSGFLRLTPGEATEQDVYISAAQVKRCELVTGDAVSGPRRPPHRSERYASLVRIDTVNGGPAAEISDRARFEDLRAEFPKARFKLAATGNSLKVIDTITPIGYGSRVTISGESFAGKSALLAAIATALSSVKDLTVLVALVGVRPEEISGWSDGPVTPQAAVSFAASTEAQEHAAELAIEQGKRLATRGGNAVVLIDTLDGLSPLAARKLLASARKLIAGGSLTVIATAEAPLGGETTVIALDREQALLGKTPALDVPASGTLHAELMVTKAAFAAIGRERAKLAL